MSDLSTFRKVIYLQHNEVCNQKYAKILPYSFHLDAVEAQGKKFLHLLPDVDVVNEENSRSHPVEIKEIVKFALISHDAIEDARMTYNDLKEIMADMMGNYKAAVMAADIVYCVTDEKGKSRAERKSDKYYQELKENRLAVFVKLADLAANTLFSKLSGSKMYDKYKKEWPKFKKKVYIPEYREFFDYVENI